MTKTRKVATQKIIGELDTKTNSPTLSATPQEPLTVLPITLNEEVLKELNLKVTQAIKNEIKQKAKPVQSEEDFVHLQNMVSEYLKCFLIIGYTMNGQAVSIGYATSPKSIIQLSNNYGKHFSKQ
jgi:hypothetical protein